MVFDKENMEEEVKVP